MNKKLIISVIMIIIIGLLSYYISYSYNSNNSNNSDNSKTTEPLADNNNNNKQKPVVANTNDDKLHILNNNVQNSIGVAMHYENPSPIEMKKLNDAGFTTVRTDINWGSIEKNRGIYDFSKYDEIVNEMEKNNIDTYFILDYANPLYDNGFAPYSEEGRKAFSNFAKEAVKRYKGKHIIWEIWNEPDNPSYWKPNPSMEDYCKLALDVVSAIRSVDKDAFIVAPAVAEVDLDYLDYLGKNNLFKYIDAVSVHPYRKEHPETVVNEYKKLKELINKYPHKDNIKVFFGEWGYSSAWEDMNDLKQAQYCIREYLTNIMCGVSLTVWYDWKDDGSDKNNNEHNFGCVYNNLEPKITYYAIKTLSTVLKDYKFVKTISDGNDSDYILMFKNNNKVSYAIWTTGKNHDVILNLNDSKIKIVDIGGNTYEDKITNKSYKINISNSVTYITDVSSSVTVSLSK